MIEQLRRLRGLGAARWFAIGNLGIALITALAVFRALPARSLWIEIVAAVLLALLGASAAGLFLRAAWAPKVTRLAGLVLLAAGLLTTASLTLGMVFSRAMSASGSPGPLMFSLILLLAIPYAIVYPACLLLWVESR